MSLGRRQKTEHAGAKNGGGHWGDRVEAKRVSKKVRRANDKATIRDENKKSSPNAKSKSR